MVEIYQVQNVRSMLKIVKTKRSIQDRQKDEFNDLPDRYKSIITESFSPGMPPKRQVDHAIEIK